MISITRSTSRFLRIPVALWILLTASSSFAQESNSDWCELQEPRTSYEELKGTPKAAYAHMYLCTLEKACEEFKASGQDGWAGGVVRSAFSYQRTMTEVRRGIDVSCPDSYSDSQCFKSASSVHGLCELGPSFKNYCDEISDLGSSAYDDAVVKWSDDHDLFLDNAYRPCFDEVVDSGELSEDDAKELKESYESLARAARKTAKSYCDQKNSSSGLGLLGSVLSVAESVGDEVMCKK